MSCSLLGFSDLATSLLDCVLDHFGWHVKRGRKCVDQVCGLVEVAGQKLVEPPQAFCDIFVVDPEHKVPRSQVEHTQAVTDKRSNSRRFRNKRIGCRHETLRH
jgi:hypothetical protein